MLNNMSLCNNCPCGSHGRSHASEQQPQAQRDESAMECGVGYSASRGVVDLHVPGERSDGEHAISAPPKLATKEDIHECYSGLWYHFDQKFEELVKEVRGYHQVAGQQDNSGGFFKWVSGKCTNCEALKRELEEKEKENKRLASQINAELRKMQGDLGQNRSVDHQRLFRTFFSNVVDQLLQQSQTGPVEGEDKRKIQELLCAAFQEVFERVKDLLLGQIKHNLDLIIFNPETSGQSSKCNDLMRAYGRLLSACDCTRQCPIPREEFKDVKIPPQISSHEYFLDESIKLSWKLLTAVPPYLPHCPNVDFDAKMHKELPGKVGGVTRGQPLRYSRPVLTNCSGDVYVHGMVRTQDKMVGGTKPNSNGQHNE